MILYIYFGVTETMANLKGGRGVMGESLLRCFHPINLVLGIINVLYTNHVTKK